MCNKGREILWIPQSDCNPNIHVWVKFLYDSLNTDKIVSTGRILWSSDEMKLIEYTPQYICMESSW